MASATGNTVQWTTQQVEVISRDLLRITVSSISPELSAGPIPVRVATPAGLSNEFYIEPAPADTPSGSPFSLINPIITFPFNINSAKTGVIVNPVSSSTGFELKWSAPTNSTVNDLQVKLSIPSTNASTTVAYRLSDNTGADAIDAWLQNQCDGRVESDRGFRQSERRTRPDFGHGDRLGRRQAAGLAAHRYHPAGTAAVAAQADHGRGESDDDLVGHAGAGTCRGHNGYHRWFRRHGHRNGWHRRVDRRDGNGVDSESWPVNAVGYGHVTRR